MKSKNEEFSFEKGEVLIPEIDIEKAIPQRRELYIQRAKDFIDASMPTNTKRAYIGDVRYFFSWYVQAMGQEGVIELENGAIFISEEDILMFIFHHLEGMPLAVDESLVKSGVKSKLGLHSLATVKRRLVSLSIWLRQNALVDNCSTKNVRALLTKICNTSKGRKTNKAITKAVLKNLIETCDSEKLLDIRDKALLLFGWASGGRRRSELSAAAIEDLEETEEGYIYHMPRSKTDQAGEGWDVPVNGKAAQALRDWLRESQIKEGKIFRSVGKGGKRLGKALSEVDINRIVKKRCEMAGLDAAQYSAHSLRSGFVTEAAKAGCLIGDIMQMTTHRSFSTLMKYYRRGNVEKNPASKLL